MSFTSMQILWNGDMSSKFKSEREVRQGDSLSPIYLCFAYCSMVDKGILIWVLFKYGLEVSH